MPELVDLTAKLDATDRRRVRVLKALIFESEEPGGVPGGATRSVSERELFENVADRIIDPPVSAAVFARLVEHSTILGPAIEAMETNIEAFGHRFVPRAAEGKLDEGQKAEAHRERLELTNLFNYIADGSSFSVLRRRRRQDYETTGYAFWEVIRTAGGQLARLRHIPAQQVRLSLEGDEFVRIDEPFSAIDDAGLPVIERQPAWRRFRTFVQGQYLLSGSGPAVRHRWFKQFGDPRILDSQSGLFVPELKLKGFPDERRAGELYYFNRYSPRTPYGLPRWWGAYLAVLGAREAEEINYSTFANNMIPSMAFLVSNGMLTEATVRRIQELIETRIAGKQNRSAFLIIEAESAFEGEDGGQVKLDIKPLQQYQHGDAMFLGYLKWNDQAVMRSMRMFPLFVGGIEGLNRSIAEIGRKLTDEQVFAPERTEIDWHINRLVLIERGYRWHRFESRTPNITDNKELIAMLAAAERTGGVNPALSRMVVEDVFPGASEIPPIDVEKLDPYTPYSLQLAERMKKLSNPTEPGQTIAPVMPPQDPDAVIGKAESNDELMRLLLDLGELANYSLGDLFKSDNGDE